MSKINFGNSFNFTDEINKNKEKIDRYSKSISTGKKPITSIADKLRISKLNNELRENSTILRSTGNAANFLKTAKDGVEKVHEVAKDVLDVISQGRLSSKEDRVALQNDLKNKIKQLELAREITVFDKKKILEGKFSENSSVRTNLDSKAVNVRNIGGDNDKFTGAGLAIPSFLRVKDSADIFTTGNNYDRINVNGIEFKFVKNNAKPNGNEILVGISSEETARNIAMTVNNYKVDSNLQNLSAKAEGGKIAFNSRNGGKVSLQLISQNNAISTVNPSVQTLQLSGAAVEAGGIVNVAGQEFTFVEDAGDEGNPARVACGDNAKDSIDNLKQAIQNHPVTKDLISRGLMRVETDSDGAENFRQRMIVHQAFETKDKFIFQANFAQDGDNAPHIFNGKDARSIRFFEAAQDHDKVKIDDQEFIFAGDAGDEDNPLQIAFGNNANASANNLKQAIEANENLSRKYNVILDGDAVILSSKTGEGAKISRYKTITIAGDGGAGDGHNVTVDGQVFVFGDAGDGQILVEAGENAAASMRNLANAISNLDGYSAVFNNGVITIESKHDYVLSKQGDTIEVADALYHERQNVGIVDDPHSDLNSSSAFTGIVGGINTSGIRNIDKFIGLVNSDVTVQKYVSGVGACSLYNNYVGSGQEINAQNPAEGDKTVILQASIAGRNFVGAVFKANDSDNINNQTINFVESATGESFSVTTSGNYPVNIANEREAQTNIADVIKNFINSTTFAQTRNLEINTNSPDIIANGRIIGNISGMTLSLNATDFTNKNFVDFKISSATNLGDGAVKFTTVIKNGNGTTTEFVADNLPIENLVRGAAIDMKHHDDTLTITLGKSGLTELRELANYAPVSEAIKSALTSSNSGFSVKIGTNFDDKMMINLPDISNNALFRDNNGEYIDIKNLSLLDQTNREKFEEIFRNIEQKLNNHLKYIDDKIKTIEQVSQGASNSISRDKNELATLNKTDILEAAEALSQAIRSMMINLSIKELKKQNDDAIASFSNRIISNR